LLPGGPLKDLNDALHELLRRAGGPSVRILEADIRQRRLLLDGSASHTRIYDVFTRDRLPDWDLLLCMVQVIAERARRHDVSVSPDEEGERFYQLWRDADDDDRQQEDSALPAPGAVWTSPMALSKGVAGSFPRGSTAIFGDTSTVPVAGSRPDMIARAASLASSPSTVPGSIPTSRSPFPAHSSDRSTASSQ
jgi:hypothetical protein